MRHYILVALGMAAAIVLVVWLGSLSEPPRYQPRHHYAYQTYNQPLKSSAPNANDERVADATVEIAKFTIVLAIATAALFTVTAWMGHLTRRSIINGENNARRELRAYIGVRPIAYFVDGGVFKTRLAMKNYGQTPAYDLTYSCSAKILPSGRQTEKDDTAKTKNILNPGHRRFMTSYIENFTTPEEADVSLGASKIIIAGEITYRDAFGDGPWSTKFSFKIDKRVWNPKRFSGVRFAYQQHVN